MRNDIPCCVADAMRHVKAVDVNGSIVGLSMLDAVFAEVTHLGPSDEAALRAELLERVKVYNYVPATAAEAYAGAVYREYGRWSNQGGTG